MQITHSEQSDSWDTYWRGIGAASAYSSGGVNHPLIHNFWDDFFNHQMGKLDNPRIIDIASGNGAVLKQALDIFANQPFSLSSLDVSSAAIENIAQQFPMVEGLVADAASIPLESSSFDLVCSQFGVEYAGQEAIFETARLVADGGYLVLLLHCQGSTIDLECKQSLDATRRLQDSGFIEKSSILFKAAFAAMQGAARQPYEDAAKQLAPAISSLEDIMREYGPHVAGDTIIRLYNDVDEIHQKIQRVDQQEVLSWLEGMQLELEAYAARMTTMSQAAINADDFELIKTQLDTSGFSFERAEFLQGTEHEQILAWCVIARKDSV